MRLRTLTQRVGVTAYRILLAGLSVALVMAMTEGAMAANIVVNSLADTQVNDGFCTLREAILNANADNQSGSIDCTAGSGADTISFTTSGVITMGSGLPAITSELTIDGGTGTFLSFQDGSTYSVSLGASLTSNRLGTNGHVTNLGTLTLANSVVQRVTNLGVLTVANTFFSGGSSVIVNQGTATVFNSTFSSFFNRAIVNCGTLRVTNSRFTVIQFVPQDGAAIYNGDINTPDSLGQLLCLSTATPTMTISNTTIANGGGDCHGCFGTGAAIYNGGAATITNTTMFFNTGGFIGTGGGIANAGTATIANSILAKNTEGLFAPGPLHNCLGAPVNDGGDNIEDGSTCGFSTANNSKPNTDPLLEPIGFPGTNLKDNGGPTATIVPCTGINEPAGCTGRSPAIDAGKNAVCAAALVNNIDQRGFVRPVDGDGDGIAICDIGAVEAKAVPPPVINNLVTFTPVPSTFRSTSDVSACPVGFVGKFTFTARLTVQNSSPPLYDLMAKVMALSNGNVLANADSGPGGVGAILTVPQTGQYADGLLSPPEYVDAPFIICLKQQTGFTFFVDVLGLTR